MPHAALKLIGGANTQETPALNENSGIAQTNLVRFMYDPNGISLVQKLGGWQAFFPSPTSGIVRALWAWEDLNLNAWLALGTQQAFSQPITTLGGVEITTLDGSPIVTEGGGFSQLAVITDSALTDITPTQTLDNVAPILTTQQGSYSVIITDNSTTGITNYDSVYIATQISIGGIVLFGLYPCSPDGILLVNGYSVWSRDQLGNLLPATSSSSLPVLASFTTNGPNGALPGSSTVIVNLPNYTYAAGDTFTVLTPTTVGGITLYGNYVVDSLIDANHFNIVAAQVATSTATGVMNGGLAQFIYSFGVGAVPPGGGYGIGMYGSGGYGTGNAVTPGVGLKIEAIDWTLDNFGEDLIACPIQPSGAGTPFQPIYVWPPGQPTATIIPEAPPVNDGIFVAMPERQIVAWGSTETGIQDPLLIRWSDVGNYNEWTDLVTNQAGDYRIPKGSRIVGAVQGPQQAIIWTDIDCWSMQYIGPPYVYSFNEIGTGCGLIARKAAAAVNGIYYWMGPSQLFTLSGNGVQPLPCSVWDFCYQDLDRNNLSKIRVAVNSLFNEISWFFPSLLNGTGEVNAYIKYNYQLNLWDFGFLARSAWVDQSVLGPPIGADPSSLILYQHETSNDAAGTVMPSTFTSGYFAISEGDLKTFVDLVWPDFKFGQYSQAQTAQVSITFNVLNYPGDTPVAYGPYTVTQATRYFNTRLRGRMVSITISSNDLGSFWRTGLLRYRYAPDGKFG